MSPYPRPWSDATMSIYASKIFMIWVSNSTHQGQLVYLPLDKYMAPSSLLDTEFSVAGHLQIPVFRPNEYFLISSYLNKNTKVLALLSISKPTDMSSLFNREVVPVVGNLYDSRLVIDWYTRIQFRPSLADFTVSPRDGALCILVPAQLSNLCMNIPRLLGFLLKFCMEEWTRHKSFVLITSLQRRQYY